MPKICNKLYINKKQKKGKIKNNLFLENNTIEIKKRFKDLKIIYYIIYI